jgi:hypothetical protein
VMNNSMQLNSVPRETPASGFKVAFTSRFITLEASTEEASSRLRRRRRKARKRRSCKDLLVVPGGGVYFPVYPFYQCYGHFLARSVT